MRRWLGSTVFVGLFALAACTPDVRQFGSGGGGSGGAGATTSTTQTGSGGTGTNSTTSTSGSGGSGGTTTVYIGPKLVKSVPANGEGAAAIEPFFLLYFDRPMSYAGATGKIKLTSDLVPNPTFAQVAPCPDGDATCIAGVFPDAFTDPSSQSGKRLPGGTKHTITVDKSFADPDGNTFDADVVVEFTTFAYRNNILDDSATIPQEAGGLAFEPGTSALFMCGPDVSNNTFNIRRIPVLNGQLGSPTTYDQPASTGGPYCYGLDIANKKLFVSHTYGYRVLRYDQLGQPAVPGSTSAYGPTTQLPVPDDQLNNVHSVTTINGGSKVLFASGYYYGAPEFSGVLSFDQQGNWGVALPAVNNFDASQGFAVTTGLDMQGTEYLYVAAKEKVLKVRASTMMIENQHTLTDVPYDPQLRTDSKGRLYVADNSGITVLDTAGTGGFKVLANRRGLRSGRIALVENGNDVTVYFIEFRGKGIIGSTQFKF